MSVPFGRHGVEFSLLNRLILRDPPIFPITFAFFTATLALGWPGAPIQDALNQLAEVRSGRITDWHPPFTTLLWGSMGSSIPAILLLQLSIYWIGLALMADQLRRNGAGWWALAPLAVGLTPMSLMYLPKIQKDNFTAGFLILAIGMSVRFGRITGLVPAALGVLTRLNATFAAPALFVRGTIIRTVLVSIAASLALLPVVNMVNHTIFGAEKSHVEKSLQLFDIVGIEKRSGRRFLEPDMRRCYSPFYWDSLEAGCKAFERTPDEISQIWISAIFAEPTAYARHRVAHFNLTTYFLVPPQQECVFAGQWHSCEEGGSGLLKDAIVRNALLWPATWLFVGLFILIFPLNPVSRGLVLSGLLYGFAYLFVSVAAGFRYFYWTELAVQLGLAWQVANDGFPRWRILAVALLLFWLIGYGFRYLPFMT